MNALHTASQARLGRIYNRWCNRVVPTMNRKFQLLANIKREIAGRA